MALSPRRSRGKRILLMLLLLGVGYYLRYGSSAQRKRALVGLGVTALLLLLGGISYYLSLPDLEELARKRRAIWENPNLTWEQKREGIHALDSRLTPSQRRQVSRIEFKQRAREMNAEMHKFLEMSPEEQAAYLKKREAERKRPHLAGPGGGGGGVRIFRAGSGAAIAGGGGAGKGGPVIFRAGGPAGGPLHPGQLQKTMLDNLSPETRAGMSYQRGLSR
jgi:hypothetical protein